VRSEDAPEEGVLLHAVLARGDADCEAREQHADDVAEHDSEDAVLHADNTRERAADEEAPCGDRKRRVGPGVLPKAPESHACGERSTTALGLKCEVHCSSFGTEKW